MGQQEGTRTLPRKENDQFKLIVKSYEMKQYKKGLKAADSILRKFPNHGETLAMRGLLLNCMERKAEAYDHVKRGLRADMRSHVCWHVYGLLHRSDRNYNDAIKSYKQALKIDPGNVQILRDLSLLQVQMRDCSGFVETRRELLRLKPNNKMHWIAYALANNLCGANETALQVIDAYDASVTQDQRTSDAPKPTYETSELALYRNVILEEEGRYRDALNHLYSCESSIVDKRTWRLRRATLLLYIREEDEQKKVKPIEPSQAASLDALLSIQKEDEALHAWVELITSNPPSADNYSYHRGLQLALLVEVPAERCRELVMSQRACELPTDVIALDPSQVARLDAVYAALAAAHPRAEAYRWLPLTYLPAGPSFESLLDSTIRRLTKRGVPALGSSLERLWDPKPNEVIQGRVRGRAACERTLAIVDAHIASLRTAGTYAADASILEDSIAALKLDAPRGDANTSTIEPPTSLLWMLYLRAHCQEWLGEFAQAISTIDECIAHTPTAVDLYEKRARILKRSGNITAAAEAMDAARQMDLADRYINNKATKYLLRAGRISDGRRTAAMFTKPEAGDSELHLKEMQAHWYELEVGYALARDGQVGPALKKFVAVLEHFTEFIDDQFDFHTYCVRKMTLRAYVSVLRFEDRVKGHVAFRRAAVAAARVYLGIHDAKVGAEEAKAKASLEEKTETPEEAAKSAEDAAAAKAKAKREKMKLRKARAKDAARAAEDSSQSNNATGTTSENAGGSKAAKQAEDDDPYGEKLLSNARDPLVEASDLADQLEKYAPSKPETHALAYDIAERKGKLLLATRSLCRLESREKKSKIVPSSADIRCYVDFFSPTTALVDRLSRFAVKFGDALASDSVVSTVARSQIAEICGATPDKEVATAVAAKVRAVASDRSELPVRVAAARALMRLEQGPSASKEAAEFILRAELCQLPSRKPLAAKYFEDAFRVLKEDVGAPPDQIEAFRSLACARFPRATIFAFSE